MEKVKVKKVSNDFKVKKITRKIDIEPVGSKYNVSNSRLVIQPTPSKFK